MNPDKLFDYLEGRLSPKERATLEEQLMSNEQLQREFAVARQIHAEMRGDSQEVILPAQPDVSQQGRKMATRILLAFLVLMFVNVGIGLYFIFWHQSRNPNRPLLEAQMREQIAKSIEQAATLTPSPNALDVSEITITAETGKLDAVANQVTSIASRLGGSVTKGIPDSGRLSVLVDLPGGQELEFRAAIAAIGGKSPQPTIPDSAEKKSFVVQIVEKK